MNLLAVQKISAVLEERGSEIVGERRQTCYAEQVFEGR